MNKVLDNMAGLKAKKYAAFCAAQPKKVQDCLGGLRDLPDVQEWLIYYNAPKLVRQLRRSSTNSEFPELPNGNHLLLYKHPLPGETQARLAYEYVLAEFVRLLEQGDRVVVENESAGHVTLWFPLQVPTNPKQWLKKRWRAFLKKLTSTKGFRKTFVLALNSAKLADGAGFSTLETPIFNNSHACIIAGLYWLAMQKGLELYRRNLQEAEDLANKISKESDNEKATKLKKKLHTIEKKIKNFQQQWHSGLQKLIEKNPNSQTAKIFKCFLDQGNDPQKLPDCLKDKDSSLFQQLEQESRGYGAIAKEQLNSARGDIFVKIVWEMVRLAKSEYETYPLPPPLSTDPFASGLRPAGDAHRFFCYSCGKALDEKQQSFKSRRLLFEAPEQRAQSAGSSRPVKVCAVCAGLSLLVPVKITEETLTVRLGGRGDVREEARRALERQVLSELGASAGDYIGLRATERADDKSKTPAPKVWGRKQYAIAKLALTLPQEVFRRGLEVYLYDKGREVRLNPFALFATAALARAYRQEISLGNDLNRNLGKAVRHFDRGQWVYGEYELLRGLTKRGFNDKELPKILREADETRKSLVEVLMSGDEQAKKEAQKQRHIVGYASLLYAFTEEARQALQKRSDLQPKDKERELRKLVQMADTEPALFLNRASAARSTPKGTKEYGYDEVRLYWNERHQYSYRWAKELLEEIDQKSKHNLRREGNAEIERRPARFLSLRPEDLVAVYAWLCIQYPSPADWRGFLYRAKLFLFTRYPRLLQD